MKHNEVDYVLVLDVSDGSGLYYYTGMYFDGIPSNTGLYTEAIKLAYKDEAQVLCDKINGNNQSFKYHIEEHAYFD